MNLFADFPSRGLDSVLHLKAHNNPNLRDFPGAARFPRVRSLVLSYAYHCCSFLASILHQLLSNEVFKMFVWFWAVGLEDHSLIFTFLGTFYCYHNV